MSDSTGDETNSSAEGPRQRYQETPYGLQYISGESGVTSRDSSGSEFSYKRRHSSSVASTQPAKLRRVRGSSRPGITPANTEQTSSSVAVRKKQPDKEIEQTTEKKQTTPYKDLVETKTGTPQEDSLLRGVSATTFIYDRNLHFFKTNVTTRDNRMIERITLTHGVLLNNVAVLSNAVRLSKEIRISVGLNAFLAANLEGTIAPGGDDELSCYFE